MNTIDTIMIENFQSHEKTIVKLAPNGQLTVITGQTDSGKSAIFRAIKWLLYNTPQGSDFIRVGCTFCRVTFNYESGHSVIREMTKTASKNQYRIIVPGADKPIILEGFGRSVPLEVQEITGVKPVTIGDNKYNLNMSEQLDGPFLGSSISAPDRAKILGKLAGTEVLDHAGKRAGTDIFRQNQNKESLETEIKDLGESMTAYDYLPSLADKIATLDRIVTDIKNKRERLNQLVCLQGLLSQIKANINICNIIIQRLKPIDMAEDIVSDAATKIDKAKQLITCREKISVIQDSMIGAHVIIKRYETLPMADFAASLAESRLATYNKFKSIRDRLETINKSINDCTATIIKLIHIDKAALVIQTVNAQVEKYNRFSDIQPKLAVNYAGIEFANEKIKKFSSINQAETFVNSSFDKVKRLNRLDNVNGLIKSISNYIQDLKQKVTQHEQRVTQLEETYHNELTALGVCPLCGSVLN